MTEEHTVFHESDLLNFDIDVTSDSGIHEILEIKETGECLYHKAFQKSDVDPQLFASILIALKDLTREIGMFEIEDITMRSLKAERSMVRYYFEQGQGCLSVVSADKKVNKAKTRKYLQKLHKIFVGKHFQKHGDQWDGNVSKFENFGEDVDQTLKEHMIPPVPAFTFKF